MKAFNKKGVSPLIATVLLIAFAVALGAVVMNWGKTQIQETMIGAEECRNIQISWFLRGGKPIICYSPSSLQLTLQNGPSRELDGIKMVVDGSEDIYMAESIISSRMGKAEARKIETNYDTGKYGKPRVIKLFPRIIHDEKVVICPMEKSIMYENPKICSE